MRRRDFISLGGAAAVSAALPRVALGQQAPPPTNTKRVGVIWTIEKDDPSDPAIQERRSPILAGLASQGWIVGRNAALTQLWNGGTQQVAATLAAQMVSLHADVVLSQTAEPALELLKLDRTTPIVFAAAGENAIELGLVDNFARPSGNVTGALNQPFSLAGKNVALLKEIIPSLVTTAFLYNPDAGPPDSVAQRVAAFTDGCAASQLRPQLLPYRTVADIATSLAQVANVRLGVIVYNDNTIFNFRQALEATLAQYRIPAVFSTELFDSDSVLANYYADTGLIYQLAGEYAGRVLNGTKIADLPVQFPTKYTLSVNLTTAASLGITIPASVQARADKVLS